MVFKTIFTAMVDFFHASFIRWFRAPTDGQIALYTPSYWLLARALVKDMLFG